MFAVEVQTSPLPAAPESLIVVVQPWRGQVVFDLGDGPRGVFDDGIFLDNATVAESAQVGDEVARLTEQVYYVNVNQFSSIISGNTDGAFSIASTQGIPIDLAAAVFTPRLSVANPAALATNSNFDILWKAEGDFVDGNTATFVSYANISIDVQSSFLFDVEVTGGVLTIDGTSGDDTITVDSDGTDLILTDTDGNQQTVPLAGVDKIEINAGDGNDTVNVTSSVNLPAIIDGGAGSDNLSGGAGQDIIFGGLGNDILNGNGGGDVLLGGAGNDQLFGGAANDVLLGGDDVDTLSGDAGSDLIWGNFTAYDDDVEALELIQAEWSSDRSVIRRTVNVIFGAGENLRGTGVRLLGNVAFDGDAESLSGGAGIDWFVAYGFG